MGTLHSLPPPRTPKLDRRTKAYRSLPSPAPIAILADKRRPKSEASAEQQAHDLYLQASEIDEARPADGAMMYQEALLLDPSLHIAITNLGNCYHRTGDAAEATRQYERALAIAPEQCEANYNLGFLALERQEAWTAIALFQRSLEADPNFADAWFNLAMAYEQTSNPVEARQCWRRYLQLEPSGIWSEIARRHLPPPTYLKALPNV